MRKYTTEKIPKSLDQKIVKSFVLFKIFKIEDKDKGKMTRCTIFFDNVYILYVYYTEPYDTYGFIHRDINNKSVTGTPAWFKRRICSDQINKNTYKRVNDMLRSKDANDVNLAIDLIWNNK